MGCASPPPPHGAAEGPARVRGRLTAREPAFAEGDRGVRRRRQPRGGPRPYTCAGEGCGCPDLEQRAHHLFVSAWGLIAVGRTSSMLPRARQVVAVVVEARLPPQRAVASAPAVCGAPWARHGGGCRLAALPKGSVCSGRCALSSGGERPPRRKGLLLRARRPSSASRTNRMSAASSRATTRRAP